MPHEDAFDFLNKHVNVSPETFHRFYLYHDLLVKWQEKINLIGNDSLPKIWERHFLDSLQLIPLIPKSVKPLIDFGTGAGFPGMVLAMYGIANVHLIESDHKKISFLKEVARITKTDVSIYPERIENIKIADVGIIVARALSDLERLLEYSSRYVSHETTCLFPKGKNYAMEIEAAKEKWQFDYKITKSITDKDGVMVIVSNLKRR